jgi:hypothetical protein
MITLNDLEQSLSALQAQQKQSELTFHQYTGAIAIVAEQIEKLRDSEKQEVTNEATTND